MNEQQTTSTNRVGATTNGGVGTNLFAKRLMSKTALATRASASDRACMHKMDQPQISKHIQGRSGNFYPVRVFWPIASRLAKAGFIRPDDLEGLVTLANNRSVYESETLSSGKAEFQTNSGTKLDTVDLAASLRFAFVFAFGNVVPKVKPELDCSKLLSLTNWSANSGYPDCIRKNKVTEKYTNWLRAWLSRTESVKQCFPYPCIVFNRTQAKDKKLKRRMVFGYPFAVSLIEQVFFHPLIDLLKTNKTIIVGRTQQGVSDAVSEFADKHVYCLDYRKFDQRVGSFWIYMAFIAIEEMLYLDQYLGRELSYIRKYFAFSRFYHPVTGVFNRWRGVPSGSGGTNLIDSLVNLMVTTYLLVRVGKVRSVHALRIHGDDIVIASNKPINIEAMQRGAKLIGMEITFTSDLYFPPGINKVHFLGSLWNNGKPERCFKTMSIQASIHSRLLERADTLEDAIKGMIYTVFGYDHRLPYIWRKLGFPSLGSERIFVYPEGIPSRSLDYRTSGREAQYLSHTADVWKYR